jgi:hypothetical protein
MKAPSPLTKSNLVPEAARSARGDKRASRNAPGSTSPSVYSPVRDAGKVLCYVIPKVEVMNATEGAALADHILELLRRAPIV